MPRQAFYFGCVKGTGDGYRAYAEGMSPIRGEVPQGCPWTVGNMDTGLLVNGRHPDVIDGKVWRTCGGKDDDFWHAFVWWDRSGDRRGNSNSGFYVRGYALSEYAEAFAYAQAAFPAIVARQPAPWPLLQA